MPIPSIVRNQWLRGVADEMRRNPTPSERRFWQVVSGRKLMGIGFRRQYLIRDLYIVDFAAPAKKLAVEIDGGYHGERARVRADGRRDRELERLGWRVVRLDAALVERDLEAALLPLLAALLPAARRRGFEPRRRPSSLVIDRGPTIRPTRSMIRLPIAASGEFLACRRLSAAASVRSSAREARRSCVFASPDVALLVGIAPETSGVHAGCPARGWVGPVVVMQNSAQKGR